MCLEQTLSYYLSPPELFCLCVILPMIISFLGLLVSRKVIHARFLNQSHDVTGPFFGTLGTVYGIFLAFVVSTMWQQFYNTQSNLVQEARYLGDLYFSAKAFSQPGKERIQTLLREYRDSVVNDEWKTMEKGEACPATAHLLEQIGEAYMEYKPSNPSEEPFLEDSIQSLSNMAGLRASRIDDSSSGLLAVLWFVILVGAVITIGFSFLFGAHNFRAQAIMTVLLTGLICMAFYTIVSLDFPFTGATTVSAEPLQKLSMR